MPAVLSPPSLPPVGVIYPESDGKPMADNTKQFEWIVLIKENLDAALPNAFVAGDLFWYPVQGNPNIKQAPDVLVALGRPKGHRRSYLQWNEENVIPQVVFEILSEGNTVLEMTRKEHFYNRHGVSEYYLYDPDDNALFGWMRNEKGLLPIEEMSGWVSPLLGIRFEPALECLQIFGPDGARFLSFPELHTQKEQAQREKEQAQREKNKALQREQLERERAERLAQKLKELGVDPESL